MRGEFRRYKVGVVFAAIECIAFVALMIETNVGNYTPWIGNALVGVCLACACITIWDVGRNWQ